MNKIKVTCNNCGQWDVVTLDEANRRLIRTEKMMESPILSVRWRGDLKWGFECICGNYSLLADNEGADLHKLVSGSPKRIKEIAKMLKETKTRFKVQGV